MPDRGGHPLLGSPLNRCFARYKIRKRRRHPTVTVPFRYAGRQRLAESKFKRINTENRLTPFVI